MPENARDIALKVLKRVDQDHAFAAAALKAELEHVTDTRDAGLAFELVHGVLRMRPWLDHLLARASDRGLKKIDPDVIRTLRLAAYQIAFLERIPPSAAVNHAVTCTKRSRASRLSGLVNALLRKLARQPDDMLRPGEPDPGMSNDTLALQLGLPRWFFARLVFQFGKAEAIAIAQRFNQSARRTLRINANTRSREDAIHRLGATARPGRLSPWSVDIDDPGAARQAVAEGWAAFQDEAAQLAVLALWPRPGERILDACAGRGGKTGGIAMLTQGKAEIVAIDRTESKLQRLALEMARQGFDVTAAPADLSEETGAVKGPFDAVLLDAPCSGSGTLGRRPEIRWRLTERTVSELANVQRRLLHTCADLVAPGGRMVYVVCSLLETEGFDHIDKFLSDSPAFARSESPPPHWPSQLAWREGKIGISPSETQTDGYQIVSLVKKS